MYAGQFYIRLILNVIVGIMFAYALYKMSKHNNRETVAQPHKLLHIFGWICMGFSLLFLCTFIYYFSTVDFPSQLRGPFIGPNAIIRSSSAELFWGYPTLIQSYALTTALATFDFLGFGAYFLHFKSSQSKWWQKIFKFGTVLLLYAFMASATNFHYFDVWEFIAPILFIVLWLIIVNRKDSPVESAKECIVEKPIIQPDKNTDNSTVVTIEQVVKEEISHDSSKNMNEVICQNDTESNKMYFCKHCGKKIEADSVFCKYCGGRLTSSGDKRKKVSLSKISYSCKVAIGNCIGFLRSIKIKSKFINDRFNYKLKRVLRISCITLITLAVTAGVAAGVWYYFDEIKPQKVAEEILLSEQDAINGLQDDELFNKCESIIRHHNIPKCGKSWRDRDNLAELSTLCWQKVEELAYSGHPEAQFILGCRYYGYNYLTDAWMANDYNPHLDYSKAAYWFLKAAEQNLSSAQNNLGVCYKYGEGVAKDMAKAIDWFKQSAMNGDDFGQLNLGDCFRDGYKRQIGKHWEKNPDYRGYSDWDYKLGYIEVEDFETILDQDMDSAKYYWQKSAEQGNAEAKERLQKIY